MPDAFPWLGGRLPAGSCPGLPRLPVDPESAESRLPQDRRLNPDGHDVLTLLRRHGEEFPRRNYLALDHASMDRRPWHHQPRQDVHLIPFSCFTPYFTRPPWGVFAPRAPPCSRSRVLPDPRPTPEGLHPMHPGQHQGAGNRHLDTSCARHPGQGFGQHLRHGCTVLPGDER